MRLEFEVEASDEDLGLRVLVHIVLLLTGGTLTSCLLIAVIRLSLAVLLLDDHVWIRFIDVHHGVWFTAAFELLACVVAIKGTFARLAHILPHLLAASPIVVHMTRELTRAM